MAQIPTEPAEEKLARMVREDLGVTINAQALRMFIRSRWPDIARAAHAIHEGNR
jgi:hypothetical protein